MRRPLDHLLPFRHRRVAGSDGNTDGRHQPTFFTRKFRDFLERPLQVLLNVVAQGLQGRDVYDLGFVLKRTIQRRPDKPIETGEERRQGLPGSGGCRDKHVAAGNDLFPGKILRFSGSWKRPLKPFLDDWMKIHDESECSVASKKAAKRR